MRFVFDTNTIVSGLLLPDSKPRQAIDRALDRGKILISIQTLLELSEVVSRESLTCTYLKRSERNSW